MSKERANPARADKAPRVDQADKALWQAATEGVLPRKPDGRAELARPLPCPFPRERERDEAEALMESLRPVDPLDQETWLALTLESGNEDSFLAPGTPRRMLIDLKRGRWVIQGELDLHGLTREEAHAAVADFLAYCKKRGHRCLRVIHGKGHSSPGGQPILRPLVRQWLRRHAEVLAFCEASPRDGGAGALMVLLRARTGIGRAAA
ncbi:MAG: Smr/MutS family protein [Zoogloeaceae bacterium]|jgi:DNA-nicking Smr family endonuclease|nr:Smr/MutS family protein [Zoogloeaceae bacterium]